VSGTKKKSFKFKTNLKGGENGGERRWV